MGEHYYVTARENGKEVRKQRTRYFSVNGTYQQFFDDIAVNATDAVPQSVMNTLMRYDYHNSVAYDDDFSLRLFGASVFEERRGVLAGRARGSGERAPRTDPLAVSLRRGAVSQRQHFILPRHLQIYVAAMYTGNYTHESKTYSFYINGRSGKVKGKAPVSPVKAGNRRGDRRRGRRSSRSARLFSVRLKLSRSSLSLLQNPKRNKEIGTA